MSKETTAMQKSQTPEERQIAIANDLRNKFNALLDKQAPNIQDGLPKNVSATRMIRCVKNAALQNPQIYECTPASIMLAIHRAAMKGLEPDGVLGYLIPRRVGYKLPNGEWAKGKRLELSFMESYRGLVQLARNSGEIATIVARTVRKGDRFERMQGTEEYLRHVPLEDLPGDEPREITHLYAVARFSTGETQFDVMSVEAIERVRLASPNGDGDVWQKHWEEMAKKTVVRRLSKMLPISFHARAAMAEQEAEEDERTLPRYVLDARTVDTAAIPALTRIANERLPAQRQTMPVVADEIADGGSSEDEPSEKKPAAKESQKKAETKPAETSGAPNVNVLRAKAHMGDQDARDELASTGVELGDAMSVNVDKLQPPDLAEAWRTFIKAGGGK